MIRKEKEKSRAAGDLEKKCTELTPRKCFRCRSEYHLIENFPKPPRENEKHQKQVCLSERGNLASQKECDNSKNKNDQKIYASMACMSDNDKFPCRYFCDSLQLTNCILYS